MTKNNDGLATMLRLCYGIAAGPSNAGNRSDGKICTAKPGECRYNYNYYTVGMQDAKSWSQPCADDTCQKRCPYLADNPIPVESEEKRRGAAMRMLNAMSRAIRVIDVIEGKYVPWYKRIIYRIFKR